MNLKLKRHKFTDESTIGGMKVGDVHIVTLEDGKREHKVYGETCIPAEHINLNCAMKVE